MEPRSFAAEVRVSDFVPVKTEWPSIEEALADLGRGLNAVHSCVHVGLLAQAARDAAADTKRDELATEVGLVKKAVGAVETRVDIAEGSVSALAKAHGATLPQGAKPMKVKADMGWKDIAKIAGTVLSGFGGAILFLQVFGSPVAGFFKALWASIMAANAS